MDSPYKEMLLSDLIRDYAPVYPVDSDWEETARYLYAEEPDHMKSLADSLRDNGWREPILISTPEELDEDETAKVFNGTHRVAIAIYEGVISLPVVTVNDYSESAADEGHTVLTVTVSKKDKVSTLSREDDLFDTVFETLRSFELNGNIWLTSDMASGSTANSSNLEYTFYYSELQTSDYYKLLTKVARKRLNKALPDLSFKLKATFEKLDDD